MDMKSTRRMTKYDVLLNLFDEIGKSMKVSAVLNSTGLTSYNTLKAAFSYFRKSPHVADESRIDVRIEGGPDGLCTRIN